MNAETKIEASLASSLASAFAEIEAALKDAKNPHFKSKYADITSVISAIKPALIKNSLYFTQRPEPAERGVLIETVVGHANGEEMSLGKLFVPANKQDAQGFGSALTYARRYALVTAFGVPVEDDDGNAAARASQGQSQNGAVNPDGLPDAAATMIIALAEKVGKNELGIILNAYSVGDIRDLTEAQGKAVIKRLNEKLAEKKETVDA